MILLVNGSPKEKGCTYTALSLIKEELDKENIESKILWLGNKAISGCISCHNCRKTGKCIFDDEVNKILEDLDNIDGFVFGSPVHYAAPSGFIVPFLDRLFYSGYGGKFDGKLGAAIVSCRRAGSTATLNQLNEYFTINSMPIVSSIYWNMVHGNKPEQVMQDLEGVQIMKTLGRNFAYMLKIKKLGEENGIVFPKRQNPVFTNFIR